ncbi:MAG: YbhB/YbcL family Raf kinase inhibitor-like protein [Chitinophagales bacterium]
MKKIWLTLAWFVMVISLAKAQSTVPALTLSTTAFEDGGIIPVKYSQAAEGAAPGGGTSPALTWTNPPAGTKSFVLHMHDLDFVHDKTMDDQVHWLVWNIPADKTGLPEGIPKGTQLRDGSYQISVTGSLYRGPGAPANGPLHHYIVELFALDTTLDLKPAVDAFQSRAMIMKAMQGHILSRSAYTGRFKRPK